MKFKMIIICLLLSTLVCSFYYFFIHEYQKTSFDFVDIALCEEGLFFGVNFIIRNDHTFADYGKEVGATFKNPNENTKYFHQIHKDLNLPENWLNEYHNDLGKILQGTRVMFSQRFRGTTLSFYLNNQCIRTVYVLPSQNGKTELCEKVLRSVNFKYLF